MFMSYQQKAGQNHNIKIGNKSSDNAAKLIFFYIFFFNFYICTVHLDTIKVYYLPMNAQVIVLKKGIKIYIKIAPTCFGAFLM